MTDRTVRVRLEAAIQGFQASMARAEQSVKEFKGEVGKASRESKQEMQTLGTAFAVTGGVIAGGMALAGKAAVDFQSSFAGVRKTVNGSEQELQAIASGMREMSRAIPTNVNDLNAIGEAAGQLGIATPNILGFTRTMADLGETTNLSADQAATSLARLANITQMSQGDFDRLGSTIVGLGNNFATTESEIVEMGLRLAGAGNQIGMAEPQILALATALTSVGIEAEAGGSALSKVMIDIASQVSTGGAKLQQFASVAGMSAQDFATQWEQDAAGALVAFITGLGNMEAQGGDTLQTLADLEITEVRMRDALLRSAGAGDLMTRALEEGTAAWEDNTALAEEAAQRYETVEARVQVARNAINDAAITIGSTFSPAVGGAADAVGGFAGAIADLPGPAAGAVSVVGGLAAAASLTAGGFLLAAPRIVETRDALKTLSATMPTTVKALRAIPALLMGPWGIALAAGATALTIFAAEQGEARRRVSALTDTLDDQTGAVTELTRAHVANRLEEEGAIDRAHDLGLSTKDLVDAAFGHADAQRLVNDRIAEAKGAFRDAQGTTDKYNKELTDAKDAAAVLEVQLGTVTGELEKSTAAKRDDLIVQAEQEGKYLDVAHAMEDGNSALESGFILMGQTRGAAEGAVGPLGDLAGGYEDVGDEAETASEKIDRFNDTVRAQFDPIFGAADALQAVADAKAEVARIRAADVGEGEEFATQAEKAQALADALDEEVRAAMDADGAMRELEAALEDGTITTGGAIRMMEGWIAQGWLSRDAADAFLQKIGDVHGELDDMTRREWNLRLEADTSGAMADIQALAAHLTTVTGIKYVHVEGSHSTVVPMGVQRHSGGMVDDSGPWRSTQDLGPRERLVVAELGERVVTDRDWSALMSARATGRDGATAGRGLIAAGRDLRPAAAAASSRTVNEWHLDGAVQVYANDAAAAGREGAWQVDRLVREMS